MSKWILGIGLVLIGCLILFAPPQAKHDARIVIPDAKSIPFEIVQPKKDWTDYGDKLVGWISTLGGVYVLIQNVSKKSKL